MLKRININKRINFLGSWASVKTLVPGWVGRNITIRGSQTRRPPRSPPAILLCESKPVWLSAPSVTECWRCGWYLSGVKRWWSGIAILFFVCVGKIYITQNLPFEPILSIRFSGIKYIPNVVQQRYVFKGAYYMQVFCQALPRALTCLILTKKESKNHIQ